jgi:hypothetical protein
MVILYIFIAIIFLAIIYFVLCYYLSGTILFLNRQPVLKNPKDYELDFEDVEFKTSDGVRIKGWLIPGSLSKLIVMTHVGGLTKYGSTTTYRSLSKLYYPWRFLSENIQNYYLNHSGLRLFFLW